MSLSMLRTRASHRLFKTTNHHLNQTAAAANNNNVIIICNRLCSTNSTSPPPPPPPFSSAESITSSSSSSSSIPPSKRNPFVTALKFCFATAFLGVAGTVGYATYAYPVEEVDEKTKDFRASAEYSLGDDASAIHKFLSNLRYGIVTGPARAVDLYLDLRRSIEEHVRGFTEPLSDKLLPDLPPNVQHIFTLVLDLNETLVYSDWKRERGWRTFKRPGVDAFLEHLSQFYEVVVYSDQLNMYVDPVVDRLDEKQRGVIHYRLSRSATRYQDGKHYRDLSKLNRDPAKVIYISGHATEHCLQRENCIEIKPWTSNDVNDTTLLDLIPFLEFVARSMPRDIRQVLASYQGRDVAKEFIERSKEHQRRTQEQKRQGRFWRH